MKRKTTEPKTKREPKVGDTKVIRKFAFFPKKLINLNNGMWYWIWLEYYYQKQVYSKGYGAYGTERFYWYNSRKYIIKSDGK